MTAESTTKAQIFADFCVEEGRAALADRDKIARAFETDPETARAWMRNRKPDRLVAERNFAEAHDDAYRAEAARRFGCRPEDVI